MSCNPWIVCQPVHARPNDGLPFASRMTVASFFSFVYLYDCRFCLDAAFSLSKKKFTSHDAFP